MLQAIICTWNEEDIIAATVKNAFAQGCDAVHLIDNESTDRTVQQALRAGAKLHRVFASDGFDEVMKTVQVNKSVMEITASSPDERNWWLYLDADEFPDTDTGQTLREMLDGLPPDVRAVGGHLCEHIPTHAPYYLPGFHPVDFMPLAQPDRERIWKYSLLRQDKGLPPLYAGSGAHAYNAGEIAIREADTAYCIHHCNYRQPPVSRKRLEALVLPDKSGNRRIAALDRRSRDTGNARSPYHDKLANFDRTYTENHWRHLKVETPGYAFTQVRRWYDPMALALPENACGEYDGLVWKGSLAFYLEAYGPALAAFTRALPMATDSMEAGLLALAIARCHAKTATPAPAAITALLRASSDPEIRRLAQPFVQGTKE